LTGADPGTNSSPQQHAAGSRSFSPLFAGGEGQQQQQSGQQQQQQQIANLLLKFNSIPISNILQFNIKI
jgi:hypothetical protein